MTYFNADDDLDRLLSGMPDEELAAKNAKKAASSLYAPANKPTILYGPVTGVFYHEKCECCGREQHHFGYAYRNRIDEAGAIVPNSPVETDLTVGLTNPIKRREVINSTTPLCWFCTQNVPTINAGQS